MVPLVIVGSTAISQGRATLDGVGNYTFRASVIDNGEPGSADEFGLEVRDPSGALVAGTTCSGTGLSGGSASATSTSSGLRAAQGR